MNKLCISITLILSLLISPGYASAEEGPFSKLGRGLANTFTGWTDIFRTVGEKADNANADVTEGFAGASEGFVRAGMRTMVGIYEVGTFPFPTQENYEPIISPKYPVKRRFKIDNIRPDGK